MNQPTTAEEYKCPVCSLSFTSAQELADHMHAHGGPQSSGARCSACGQIFNTDAELAEHSKTHFPTQPEDLLEEERTPGQETDPVGAAYSCEACGARFASQDELTVHGQQSHLHPIPGEAA